jgi:hypothetical protein
MSGDRGLVTACPAAKVSDLNFKYRADGKGATVTARFGPDRITIFDPNHEGEDTGAFTQSGELTYIYRRGIKRID